MGGLGVQVRDRQTGVEQASGLCSGDSCDNCELEPVTQRLHIQVTGRVQGVGFRPTVYRYATELGLTGSVRNDSTGVLIDLEGAEKDVDRFVARLREDPPPQARIQQIDCVKEPPQGEGAFAIIPSTRSGELAAGMPPDLATCPDCIRELFDPADRRYRYPFLNCTNCGPRFTIINSLPYDRDKTSMVAFTMCPRCEAEYEDPANRRFDAQPNACPVCGPRLAMKDPGGNLVKGDPLEQAVARLRKGDILAVKGLGGFHLCCLATDDNAVDRLRQRKQRPHKALAVMFAHTDDIRRFCHVNEWEEAELISAARPVVIVNRRPDSGLAAAVAPDTNDIGAFLPYTPLHHLLLQSVGPLVMTSANIAEEPIATTFAALGELRESVVDGVLDHNRPIARRCDDSVLKMVRGRRLFFRRSRGFVPAPVDLPLAGAPVLACGAELKNTFCVTRGQQAYVSQHIGDLTGYGSYTFFEEAVPDLCRLLEVQPAMVAHDLHPDYLSTRFAETLGGEKVAVQHHHAHIASCMVDNGCREPVIGVARDGTGHGPDGTVWGGEFLVADLKAYRRALHFKPYPLPGGDAAVRFPSRMALSVLVSEGIEPADWPAGHADTPPLLPSAEEQKLLQHLIRAGTHSPLTSSAGRLFDAVSALLGVCGSISYEGQAAIRLQTTAAGKIRGRYRFDIANDALDFGPAVHAMLRDLHAGVPRERIAAMFHNTVAGAAAEACALLRQQTGIENVALSGGVFQNELLLNLLVDGLRDRGFTVLTQQTVPPNDAGIALGQAAVALARQAEAH